jgi:hypothetical protein
MISRFQLIATLRVFCIKANKLASSSALKRTRSIRFIHQEDAE